MADTVVNVGLPSAGGLHAGAGKGRSWSEAEDAIIAGIPRGEIPLLEASIRLGRTVEAILRRLGRLEKTAAMRASAAARAAAGVTQSRWTKEEEEKAVAMHRTGASWTEIGRALHRTPGAVQERLERKVLRPAAPEREESWPIEHYAALPLRRPWTPAEDDLLATRYTAPGCIAPKPASIEVLAQLLHRPAESIHTRARIIGIVALPRPPKPEPEPEPKKRTAKPSRARAWTAGDDRMLAAMWAESSVLEISRRLGRTPGEVRTRAARLGIGGSKPAPRPGAWWTDAEDQALRTDLRRLGAAAMAQRLGRPIEEVEARALLVMPGADASRGSAAGRRAAVLGIGRVPSAEFLSTGATEAAAAVSAFASSAGA